jgi:LPS export ABC transporter protein LptC
MTLFKARNLLLLLALLLAVALAAIIMVRYRPPVEIAEVTKALPEGVKLALQDIDYTHTEGGVARWRLVAKQAAHHGDNKEMAISDLRLTFFDEQGIEQGTLQARNGRVSDDFTVVEVQDNVEIVSQSGYTLRTEHLVYDHAERLIRTDAAVHLKSKALQLDGVGLDLDLATRHLRVRSRVHATLQPDR